MALKYLRGGGSSVPSMGADAPEGHTVKEQCEIAWNSQAAQIVAAIVVIQALHVPCTQEDCVSVMMSCVVLGAYVKSLGFQSGKPVLVLN